MTARPMTAVLPWRNLQKGTESRQTAAAAWRKQGCTVSGEGPEAAGVVIGADPNTNVLYANTSIPAVAYKIRKGEKVRLETRVETFVKEE